MVREGMTDAEIGALLGVQGQRVYHIRKQLGIPAGRAPGGWQGTRPEGEQTSVPVPPSEIYEENGHTVRRYPALYADGVPAQPTARPRR